MTTATQKSKEELEKLIQKAIQKVQGKKENDLCKYIPGPTGGYMHHFTMRKLKHTDPAQIFGLLQKFIVESDSPRALAPKSRAPRGSRKMHDFVNLTRSDLEKVIELARKSGDRELLARFTPKRTMPSIKRDLIRSIRANTVQQELWDAYAEALNASRESSQV